MKYLIYIIIPLLCGCAGQGVIREYDIVDGEKVLIGITEFKGRNIKAETKDGAKIETKSWTIPNMPSTIIR
ncbi:hypothetical protein LCGC14_3124780 [marine sediment metagenome]|uniref:Uncharacterized protein n=1 Tax=marine sediment metagenome TaxID=412755 RepID=A0A0F8W1H3_9ZZZZ